MLALNYPAGTSELFPLGANSDLRKHFTLRRNVPAGLEFCIYVEIVHYVEIFPLALWSDFLFVPNRIYSEIVHYVKIVLQASQNLFPFGASSDLTWE